MYLTNLTPLSLPPTRRRFQQQPAEATAPSREPIYDTAPKRPTDAKAIAAQIIAAGARRRGEISDGGAGLTHPVARAIVRTAALVRSGGPPPSLPEHPLARAICLAGEKRRGMIDAAGARELDDYLRMLQAREVLR
jgi:hypothetical protein